MGNAIFEKNDLMFANEILELESEAEKVKGLIAISQTISKNNISFDEDWQFKTAALIDVLADEAKVFNDKTIQLEELENSIRRKVVNPENQQMTDALISIQANANKLAGVVSVIQDILRDHSNINIEWQNELCLLYEVIADKVVAVGQTNEHLMMLDDSKAA